ncbi:MAG: cell division protein FtsL, partial [Ruthenibacterium sp.]
LYSQTKATEMSGQIAMQQQELVDLQSEYTYLSNEVEMKTNLTSVEEYARTKLGLVKIDKSQITYVERKNDEVIVRPKNELQKIFGSVSTQAMSFMEYLTP